MVDMQDVESSNVAAIGYDPETQELSVSFTKSGTYVYHDVGRDTYDELMQAESKGKYLNQRIKGTYEFTSPPDAAPPEELEATVEIDGKGAFPFPSVSLEPIPKNEADQQFVKGRKHLEKHILGEAHEHPLHDPSEDEDHDASEDLLTLTMTRFTFETLQRLLNNTLLNADDGAVHVVLTESASGVVTLETHKGPSPGAEDDEEDCPWHDGFAGE